jgi:hypothetical protein
VHAEDGFQICTVATNISWTTEKGQSSNLGFERGAKSSTLKEINILSTLYRTSDVDGLF